MTDPCQTVRTPGASVTVEDWTRIRATAERTGIPPVGLALAALHLLATSPRRRPAVPVTQEDPHG